MNLEILNERPALRIVMEFLLESRISIEREAQKFIDKWEGEIEENNKILDKLYEFEEKHKEELESILPNYRWDYYLMMPMNELWGQNSAYRHYKDNLKDCTLTWNIAKIIEVKGLTPIKTYQEISEKCKLSLETVKDCINTLIYRGFIAKVKEMGGNCYQILDLNLIKEYTRHCAKAGV